MEAKLPNRLAISDTELCSLLSNALENALRAVSELPEGQRHVSLYCGVRQNKLLIEVRNPYAGTVYMQNGVPASVRGEGHGYGCRSIQTIAERNGGLCVFTPEESDVLIRPGPRMAEAARLMAACLERHAGGAAAKPTRGGAQ